MASRCGNGEQDSFRSLGHPAPDVTPPSLLTLPDIALALISQHSITQREVRRGPHSSHPLLAASRGFRDMALSSLHSITLDPLGASVPGEPPRACDPAPWARLLSRACFQARSGLTVKLRLSSICNSLPELLQPGINCGGWSKVHSLEVIYASCGTHLIPQAFPGLHSLSLTGAQLGGGSLFNLLAAQPNPSLTSLQLVYCPIDSEAVQHAAVALAQLPGLQALHLEDFHSRAPVGLAQHLTGLTSLTIETEQAVLDKQQVAVVTQNKGLRSLSLVTGVSTRLLKPRWLQQMLTSCTGLTQLTIMSGTLNDEGLCELLTHGTSITDLTLGETELTSSKADWACSWRSLTLLGELHEFAYLPLKSVRKVQVQVEHGGPDSGRKPSLTLSLPHHIPAAQLPDLLHQATRNLASCPAWVKTPAPELELGGSADTQGLTSAQRVQLLQALAPVAGKHVKKLRLCVSMQLGQAEVEAVAGSFPSSLTHVYVGRATLPDSFWRPLAQHFPNLQELCLGSGLKADPMSVAMYLTMCSCCAPQGMHAVIECFNEKDATHLQSCVDAWGLQNIHLDVKAVPDTPEDGQ